ncbi:MAG: RagB/SusD family nutrient uptake outer membrane protein [Pedobacter sp.]|nr:MAG: RagB/SusD family nutrient uptake outer membrane protein [Pedobacter sp.]
MKHNIFLISCLTLLLSGCASDYLDIKPNQALVVPSELSHYQAIIDAFANGMNDAPGLPVIAADEFYLLENEIQNASTMERNTYLWNKDIFEGAQSTDWNVPYRCIFYANVAIDGLEKLSQREKQTEQWRQAYGGALFFRAHALFNLSQMFAAGYNVATANNLPGLPIRKTMNINEIVGRGTLQQTYDQILEDLNNAEKLLSTVMDFENRPSKAAASALLARIYLVMGSYDKAKESATASLGIYQKLLNYNTLNPAAVRPFPITLTKGNPEVMFVVRLQGYTAVMNSTTAGVDSILYKSYHQNDLRKSCYFTLINGQYRYKGSYQGSSTFFGGLSTSEQYLILAECHARQGETELALHNLNTLLRQRFVTGTFQELTADNNTILPLVLLERRKELFARGLRWSDLKRLNQNPATAVTLTKRFGAQQYTLAPNDKRYAFPIPDGEIELSGIDQNPR